MKIIKTASYKKLAEGVNIEAVGKFSIHLANIAKRELDQSLPFLEKVGFILVNKGTPSPEDFIEAQNEIKEIMILIESNEYISDNFKQNNYENFRSLLEILPKAEETVLLEDQWSQPSQEKPNYL